MHFIDIPEGQYPIRNGWRFWQRGGWLTVQHFTGTTHVWWTAKSCYNTVADEITFIEVDESDRLLSYRSRSPMMGFRTIWDIEKGTGMDYLGGELDAQRRGIRMAITMLRTLEPLVVASQLSGFRHQLMKDRPFP